MPQPSQIFFLHCTNPKCRWKIKYKGSTYSHPDFCPKCGWLAFYHCHNCAPSYSLQRRFTEKPEPSLFENGVCRLCRAQSKGYALTFLKRLLEELSSASGFVAKDQIRYVKELDKGPDSMPFQLDEKLYSDKEHKKKILNFYREDCELDLEQVTVFLRTNLDRLNLQA